MSNRFQPLYDRVLLKPLDAGEKTQSGLLYVPDIAHRDEWQAEVIAVGQGEQNERTGQFRPLDVKAGDKVIMGKYSGTDLEIDGEKFMIVREAEILGVLEASPA